MNLNASVKMIKPFDQIYYTGFRDIYHWFKIELHMSNANFQEYFQNCTSSKVEHLFII